MATPTLSGLDAATFNENTVNATPQVIDSAVLFADADNNFNGGTLKVSGLLAEDRISILSGLTISLSGGVVYYDADGAGAGAAVAIGTASGGVGATFTVTFNASATSVMIDALIQNLTYANTSDTPTASRTLAINVTDATGAYLSSSATPTLTLQSGAANPWNAVTTTGRSAPTFGDLDGDGDKDLIVGQSNGTFKYFQNTGTASSPLFEERTGGNNPLNGVSVTISAKPVLGDMDGDGDLDLIVTNKNGLFSYFRNTGTTGSPTFTAQTGGNNPLSAFSAGTYASPTLGDIDGDGDLDLFVGQELGTVRYFRNIGTATGPVFEERTAGNHPASGITGGTFQTNWAAPALVDLNGDGDLDLIIGNTPATFRYFENTGTTTSPTYVERTGSANPLDGVRVNLDFGANPTFVDIDGDGDRDLVSGVSDSGILAYFQNTTPLGVTFTVNVTAEADGPTVGPDSFTGTGGNDTLEGLGGDDILDGGNGDDVIDGGTGTDTLAGGAGADYLRGGSGADAMAGGTGNDTYVVDDAGDTADETGGDGIDLVIARLSWTLGSGLENLTLGNGGPLNGTGNALANVINGNSSANTLSGLAGNDTLNGGGGSDVLNGGDDDDTLNGESQNDSLNGGAGTDTLNGGDGNDALNGGTGVDAMTGGAGNDSYVVDDILDTVTEGAAGGTDSVSASVSFDLSSNVENITLTGSGDIQSFGNGLANTMTGNSGANHLVGGGGNDTLSGMDGDDSMLGDSGNDSLSGGNGADALSGEAGSDRMSGGAGADVFMFWDTDMRRSAVGQTAWEDTITDINFAGGDRIDLSAIDANVLTLGVDDSFVFVSKLTGVAGQAAMTVSGGRTFVRFDVDGDGKADLTLVLNGDQRASMTDTGASAADGGWYL